MPGEDYQIDPHLRHDFPPLSSLPPTPRSSFDHPPPWSPSRSPSSSGRPWWWRRRWRSQQHRIARWLWRQEPYQEEHERRALRWLVAALTLIVLLETALLILGSQPK